MFVGGSRARRSGSKRNRCSGCQARAHTTSVPPAREGLAGRVRCCPGHFDDNPAFAWAALDLGLKLSVGNAALEQASARCFDPASHSAQVRQAVEEAISRLDRPTNPPSTSLHAIPPAWVHAPPPHFQDLYPGERQPTGPIWRDPDVFLRWDFLPKVLGAVPIDQAMSDPLRRTAFLDLCDQLVAWTIARLKIHRGGAMPRDAYDHPGRELFEWRSHLYGLLGRVALHMDSDEARRRFLEPVFPLDDETAASLISPFASLVGCAVMDAPVIEPRAIALLVGLPLDASCRARTGNVHEGMMAGCTVLACRISWTSSCSSKSRPLAARPGFANGDWREVELHPPYRRSICPRSW